MAARATAARQRKLLASTTDFTTRESFARRSLPMASRMPEEKSGDGAASVHVPNPPALSTAGTGTTAGATTAGVGGAAANAMIAAGGGGTSAGALAGSQMLRVAAA
jgi:hypothetical protein